MRPGSPRRSPGFLRNENLRKVPCRVDWHGQSAFTLGGEAATVFIDPWGDMSAAASKGVTWDYPPIAAPAAVDLLIVTHEHLDHNAVEVIDG